MSSEQFNQQRTFYLRSLDRVLNRIGTFGTALVDPDDELDDIWTGLLVWNIADGAQAGIVLRCCQGLPGGKWRYCHDNGAVIADVDNHLAVVKELTKLLTPRPAPVQG
jgi:hypothetical protein